MTDFSLEAYDYILPDDRIAQASIHPHHDSRLMIIDRETGNLTAETTFWWLPEYLPSDRVLVWNTSRVIRARIPLHGVTFSSPDGREKFLAEGEIFFLQIIWDGRVEVLVRPGKYFRVGNRFELFGYFWEVVWITESGRILSTDCEDILGFFEMHGQLPLPPYIEYEPSKEQDYQSIWAKNDGSVAAPTASLHFTPELMAKIENPSLTVTLHIGLGTFAGIQTDDIRDYQIHREMASVPLSIFDSIARLKSEGKLIVGVGTTASRTLESLPYLWKILSDDDRQSYNQSTQEFWDSVSTHQVSTFVTEYSRSSDEFIFATEIYIYPGYETIVIDEIITNFHLPRSSLLVFISALIGRERILELYQYAIQSGYRFFSFGDGMYIRKR